MFAINARNHAYKKRAKEIGYVQALEELKKKKWVKK
jgi:hypothetical protein